jgi:hypothetical protein
MATEPKPSENVKVDLFEDDDEFEEFEINEGNFKSFQPLTPLHSNRCCNQFQLHSISIQIWIHVSSFLLFIFAILCNLQVGKTRRKGER